MKSLGCWKLRASIGVPRSDFFTTSFSVVAIQSVQPNVLFYPGGPSRSEQRNPYIERFTGNV